MILGTIYQPVYEDFIVIDSTSTGFAIGINTSEFSAIIYDNNRNLFAGPVTFYELGNGAYRCEFTPDSLGTWFITVIHPVHFPYGKSNTVQVYSSDLNILTRMAGLMQENYSIDQTMYDANGNLISSRIRIYDSPSNVGTNTGVIATYNMTATYNVNEMTSYNVERV